MAKKEKVQLSPEERAAKKLKRKKGWARFFAVVLAVAITACVYSLGSKDGPKEVTIEPQTVVEEVTVTVKQTTTKAAETTTKAAETTTKAAETTTKKVTTTAASSDDSSSGLSDILGTITDTLSGLVSGIGSGSSSSLIDGNSVADTVEGVGSSAKDFFYGVADKIEDSATTTTTQAAEE